MRTTIDRAGRIVIPAALRERAGLTPGSELEVSADEQGIRIERVAPGPRRVRVGRRLVARPTAPHAARPTIDAPPIQLLIGLNLRSFLWNGRDNPAAY